MKQIGTPICVPASVSASVFASDPRVSKNDRRDNTEKVKQGTMAEVKIERRNTC